MSFVFQKLIIIMIFLTLSQLHAKSPAQAIHSIANYTSGFATEPIVSDYVDAGIVNIGTHNLAGINDKIAKYTYTQVNTQIEIQAVVDEYNLMIATVLTIVTSNILNSDTLTVIPTPTPTPVPTVTPTPTPIPNTPTLTSPAPAQTTESNVTVEVNGPVGNKVFVNGVEVATLGAGGQVFVVLDLSVGSNAFSITLKDADERESAALSFFILRQVHEYLVINEISAAYYINDTRWFEIYNPTMVDIDVSEFTLKSRFYDGATSGTFEFAFPSKNIPAGGYLIVKPNHGPAFGTTLQDIENAQVMYLKDSASNKYPFWYSDEQGFLELLKNGNTVDFVTIGYGYTPTTPGAWIGSYIPTFTTNGTEFWKSIARNINSEDNDVSSDWHVREFPTYAAINDVTCNDDVDEDGIPDCSEVSGSTYAGMDIYAFGARVNQKDIFIEIDYMDSTNGGVLAVDEGVIPQKEALEKVKTSFANNGYSVHFDVGDLYDNNASAIDPAQMDLGGGNEVPYVLSVSLNSDSTENKVSAYKRDHMNVSRKTLFYYMLFGTSQNTNGSFGSSGRAELPGNDSLITLGGWGLSTSTVSSTNALINFQAGTVMHEFGHNLNLEHGGDEGENFKPNYLSVMNYLYQLDGLATIGDNEGDRYNNNTNGCTYMSLTNSPYGDSANFVIDYSNGSSSTLNEVSGIDEALGLGRTGSVPVDYNCNNSLGDTLTNFNVNPSWNATKDTVTDHDDWGAINIVFARTDSGQSGISQNKSTKSKVSINPLINDIQPEAVEPPIAKPKKNP